ncbi:MAG: DUF945 family protein [Motiliproteus sp.]
MKKWSTITVIGLIALIGLSATFSYMGRTLTQQAFDRQVATLLQTAPLYQLQLVNSNLEHSLFTGTATLELLVVTGQPEPKQPLTVALNADLQYGPLLFTPDGIQLGLAAGQTQLALQGLDEKTKSELQQLLGTGFDLSRLVTINHSLSFDRQLQLDALIPPIQIQEDNKKLVFEGSQVSSRSDIDSGQTQGTLTVGSVRLNNEHGSVSSATGHGRFDYSDVNDPLATGHFILNLPSIEVNQPAIKLALQGLSLEVEQQQSNGKIDVTESIKIANIDGELPVTAASATYQVKQINPAAVEQWQQLLAQTNQQPTATPSEAQLRELVSAFMQPGLQFNQSYQVEALDGQLDASLDVEFRGLANGLHPLDITNPRQLIDGLKASLFIETDPQIAMALPIAAQLPQLFEQGIVVEQAIANGAGQPKLQIKAELNDGQLVVNGQPFPIESMLPTAY